MNPYWDFDRVVDRRGTNSLKYDLARKVNPFLPEDFIPLWVADMDFPAPRPVLDAMKARIDHGILGYAALTDEGYYDAVVQWMKTRHNFETCREEIVLSEGVVTAMGVAVRQLTRPGDKVLMHTPGYHPFEDQTLKNGRVPVYSRLVQHGQRWEVDWDDFARKVKDPGVKLLFLCSPQNPTGRVWTEDELRRMADLCFANGVFIFCDEIHNDLLRCGVHHVSLASLYPGGKDFLTATAPSKTFNIPGNSLANLIVPDRDLAHEWRREGYCGHVNILSAEACKAAYLYCADWLDALRVYLDGNFAWMKTFLEKNLPKAAFTIPDATYLAWVDLRGIGLSDQEMEERTSRAGLFIQFARDFIRSGEGFARINLGCPRSTEEKGMERLKKALA